MFVLGMVFHTLQWNNQQGQEEGFINKVTGKTKVERGAFAKIERYCVGRLIYKIP
ncbi:hypothetical protein NT017_33950 [Prolixibacter sp. NT017]|nr:hypothetical protein NT017_33950 [Prolixibacter sp. NT017]